MPSIKICHIAVLFLNSFTLYFDAIKMISKDLLKALSHWQHLGSIPFFIHKEKITANNALYWWFLTGFISQDLPASQRSVLSFWCKNRSMDIFNWNDIIFGDLTDFSCVSKDILNSASRKRRSIAEENPFEKFQTRETSSVVKTTRRSWLLKRW